ncbi:GGDEF domain-containing phosphodiesterase [Spirochaetia bacterium 38H-sp]|uniref:GGDEF domain-containing phosphodiesterase n=1 Tax=Rarispira pelagica TaxID=3141764 RepID=A0ABU9UAJ8_9SPIR
MKLSELESIFKEYGLPDDISKKVLSAFLKANELRKEYEEKLDHYKEMERLINLNPDTGLPVRRYLEKKFSDLKAASDSRGKKLALFLIRLDDKYARIQNNRDRSRVLLFKTAHRILRVTGGGLYQGDRLDEFFLARHVSDAQEAIKIANEIVEEVSMPQEPPASDVQFGCYISIVIYPDHGNTFPLLIEFLAMAMADIYSSARRVLLYEDEIGRKHLEEDLILDQVKQVISNGFEEFDMYYQPIVDASYHITGCEALIRWNSAAFGNVNPARFIPLVEQTGDITVIGQWTLYQACKQLKRWHDDGYSDLFVSVNLSPPQFKLHDLTFRVAGILKSLAIDGRFLKLEVTEGVLMENPEEAIAKMQELKSLGIKFSIDDFGTGYSSLAYIQRFPFDTVKIDRSFLENLEVDLSQQSIVRAVIGIARSLNLVSLAEGVESRGQLDFLINEGCQLFQGFYFSKPVSSEKFELLLKKGFSHLKDSGN